MSSEKTAIDSRWVFKCKKEAVSTVEQTEDHADDHDQNIDNLLSKSWAAQCQQEQELMKIKTHYKIHLVVKNYEQWYKVDFWATFSSIFCMIIIRMLLTLTVYYHWNIHQMNVKMIFLNTDLDTEIYMKMFDEMNDHVREFLQLKDLNSDNYHDLKSVLQLHKSLYNLKQFSHEWNKNINIKLKKLNFCQSEADSSLYILTFKDSCFILLYMNNMLLVGSTEGILKIK